MSKKDAGVERYGREIMPMGSRTGQFVQGKREKNPHEENKMGPKEYFELLHLMHCKERK